MPRPYAGPGDNAASFMLILIAEEAVLPLILALRTLLILFLCSTFLEYG